MKNYLTKFLNDLNFATEAKDILLNGNDQIEADAEFSSVMSRLFKEYENGEIDWKNAPEIISENAKKINLHKYTAHLIFFICMTKHTKKLYEDKGLSYELFKDTFSDFKYKLNECQNHYGICGTSCETGWYKKFFTLERFALGRLQYEVIPYRGETPYTKDGVTVNPGDPVLNTHIPSSGPLTPDLVDESFALAHEFFRDKFDSELTPISCNSWLLFPEHYNMLSPTANIIKFMDKFEIVSSGDYDGYPMFITVFNKPYDEDLSTFAQDTSIQRAYLELARNNKPGGWGLGITLYKG